METVTLFRPVGQAELDLVERSGWTKFPPRLPEQPIFYPVCNLRYATDIALRWNARDGGVGFVLQFEVRADYLRKFDVHTVGSHVHKEYWIPAEQLEEFNAAIVGEIELVSRTGLYEGE